ncbi:MAG: hypothetical protein JJU15_19860 [Pararhodobacter sp.]|nr:hypothetical protein [Pararhodobacter sp.]
MAQSFPGLAVRGIGCDLVVMGTLLKILSVLVALYAVAVIVMALAQGALLFPRWAMGGSPPLPSSAVELRLERPGGVVLAGHLLPGTREDAPLLLGFGGNAWDGAAMVLFLRQVFPEHDVAAFHYRGYAPSTGRPSARALLEDSVAVHDHLAEGRAVVAVGFSVGAGPAAHLAQARALQGVLLVTAFDSLEGLARGHYPWAPVRWLLRHRMEPAADLAASGVPVALISAERDTIIPRARTQALREALAGTAPGIVFDRVVAGGHNDIYARSELADAMRAALLVLEED